MSVSFSPCPACSRHVRVSEDRCPFCAASIAGLPVAPRARPRAGLGRAALFAFGIAALAPGCYDHHLRGGEVLEPAVDAAPLGPDAGSSVALYGTPAPEVDGGQEEDAGSGVGLLYGAPAFDEDAGEGAPSADYGGPPAD